MDYPKVTIYTDGSWRGSLRAGGYAAFITDQFGHCMLVGDGIMNTTISRMELSAMVTGLSYLIDGCDVTLISDSQYACNIVNKWLYNWNRNNYKKQDGTDVANQDILTQLQFHKQRMHSVKAIWVKSHTGYTDEQSVGNDLVDWTAVHCATQAYQQNNDHTTVL
jgi:ribonuclease HI